MNGLKALYIASHACGIEGMDDDDAQALIDQLIVKATLPEHVYAHHWQVGDVIIWDERAVLHRGTPWPMQEERSLVSYCVTAGEQDGLASVRPAR